MKKNHKGKKTLTAVGAVVAAGLTPGFIAATPGCLPAQGPNTGITAADAVAIDGQAYSFDELYAKQHPDSAETKVIELDVVLEPDTTIRHDVVVAISTTKYGAHIPPREVLDNYFEVIEGDTIYRSVNRAPQFPGGDAELLKYIHDQIQYPANALKNKTQGKVVIELVVKKTGEIGTVKVLLSIDEDLDREAVRICKSLPNFIPARRGGKAVSSWLTLTVTFTLPEKNDN